MEILNNENLNDVLASDDTIIIDFFANWCTSCKLLMPKIEQLSSNNNKTNVKFFKANVEDVGEFAKLQGVRNIPCLLIMKGNEVIGRQIGDKSIDVLEEFIKSNVN